MLLELLSELLSVCLSGLWRSCGKLLWDVVLSYLEHSLEHLREGLFVSSTYVESLKLPFGMFL